MPHQTKVLQADARFKLVVCGRRWGKTASGMMAGLLGHGPTPGRYRGAISGARIWWIAPTYKQMVNSNIWVDLCRACDHPRFKIREEDKTIKFPGGGSISIRSADSGDSLRGPGLDGVILDEKAFLRQKTWQEEIRPSLADKQGWAIGLTTPNGKNWFHKLFVETQSREGWMHWQCPSSENPLIHPDELAELKRDLGPRLFAQEHEAQFTDIEGAAFPGEYFEPHIWADGWPEFFEHAVIAIDPSMGAECRPGDFSAIVFIGLRDGLLWIVADVDRRPPMQIVEDAIRMYREMRPMAVGCEANGFQGVLRDLFDAVCQREQMPPLPLFMITNKGKKRDRILRLDAHLARKQIRIRRNKGGQLLVEQLEMFPDKQFHDDAPDAVEMGVRLMESLAARDDEEQDVVFERIGA